MPDHTLFIDHMEAIDRTIDRVAQRAGWFAADADEFRSWVHFKLLEDECRILRRYEGRSSVRTYITVVVTNLMRDFRNARFGKWRPSRHSRRLGTLAVRLDRLVNRDSLTVDQAVRSIASRSDCEASESELRALAVQVPVRPRRHLVDVDRVGTLEADTEADERLWAGRRRDSVRRLSEVLERCMEALDDEDQVILRLRYWEGLSIADVARALGLPQRPLYRRIPRCLERLAEAMRDQGVDETQVCEALAVGAD